jgi:hypothetical protein
MGIETKFDNALAMMPLEEAPESDTDKIYSDLDYVDKLLIEIRLEIESLQARVTKLETMLETEVPQN